MKQTIHKKVIKPKKNRPVLRWMLYILILCICYVFQAVGHGAGALWVIPAGVMISMNESEVVSAIVGATCGLMIDDTCDRLSGFNGLLMLFCCVGASLLFRLLLRTHIINVIVVVLLSTAIINLSDYFINYVMWDYENAHMVLSKIELPSFFWTASATVVLYPLLRWIKKKWMQSYTNII